MTRCDGLRPSPGSFASAKLQTAGHFRASAEVQCKYTDLRSSPGGFIVAGAGAGQYLALRKKKGDGGRDWIAEGEQAYNLATIRDLLQAAFTADDLRRLVVYTSNPALQPLAHEFSSGEGLTAMVEKTVTYCQKQGCIPNLLAEVKEANPRRYAQYEDDLLAKG